MLSRHRDSVAGAVVVAVAAAAVWLSYGYSASAAMFPRAVAIIMGLCGALLFARGLRWPTRGEPLPPQARARIGAIIVLTLLYIALMQPVGYFTSTAVFIPVTACVLGLRRPVLIGVSTIVFLVVVYLLFERMFLSPLPREFFLRFFE